MRQFSIRSLHAPEFCVPMRGERLQTDGYYSFPWLISAASRKAFFMGKSGTMRLKFLHKIRNFRENVNRKAAAKARYVQISGRFMIWGVEKNSIYFVITQLI
jgi:hypothetical protein